MLARNASRSTSGAEPPENYFVPSQNPLAESAGSRLPHVVPLQIFDVAAAIADEVVMTHAFSVESRGAPLHGHFPHQARAHQIPQIVVGGGA